jgi:putative SOS response-associated peptidase YedK
MCGRFTLTDPDPRMLKLRFDLRETAQVEGEAPRYNVAPTDNVLAVRLDKEGERELGRLRWGLIPHYADPDRFDRLLINARAETVASAPAFRDAFEGGFRCLVVADGFYEWRATEKGKQPYWVHRPGREPFAFAGLWARALREDGSKLYSGSIVTCPPSEPVAPIHDRMPVILDREDEGGWLDRGTPDDELLAMLRPAEELELTEVNEAVNSVREDGPHLLDPPLQLF